MALRLLRGRSMIQTWSSRRLLLSMWLVLMGGLLALGLYAGYRWPEVTATLVLVTLVGIWTIAERVTAGWW